MWRGVAVERVRARDTSEAKFLITKAIIAASAASLIVAAPKLILGPAQPGSPSWAAWDLFGTRTRAVLCPRRQGGFAMR